MKRLKLSLGVCSVGIYLVWLAGAGAQTVNYELFDNGSSFNSSPGVNTYGAIRLDHVNNKYFTCSAVQDNNKKTLTGQCSPLMINMPAGNNIKTIIVGGTKADQTGSTLTLWEIDQTTGATYLCIGQIPESTAAWCTILTINP